MFKVDRLKRYLRAHPEMYNNSTKRTMAPNSDNPALAWIVEKNDVINMISSAQYD
jgi:hypothetical protein